MILLGLASFACEDKLSKMEGEPEKAAAQPLAPAPALTPAAPKPSESDQAVAEKAADKPAEKKNIVCPKPPKVQFSDPALETEVRRKAQKPEGDLTLADLKKVRSVDLTRSGAKVNDLDPCIFPLLTNLHHLYLGGGELNDITPLKGLTQIEGLRLSMNSVSDITPLAGMINMDRLDLGRTQVRDLTPLKGMKNMTELQLDDTPVQDLSPLAGLKKLERLSIKRTRVTDVSPLKGLMKLKFLYINGAPIENPQAAMHPGLKITEDE
jgi:internalin A